MWWTFSSCHGVNKLPKLVAFGVLVKYVILTSLLSILDFISWVQFYSFAYSHLYYPVIIFKVTLFIFLITYVIILSINSLEQFILILYFTVSVKWQLQDQLPFPDLLKPDSILFKYVIYNEGLLPIVKNLKEWQPELNGTLVGDLIYKFTDNKNLKYFMWSNQLNWRQIHLDKFYSEFKFRIIYCSGK